MKIGIVGWGVEAQSAHRFFGPEHDYLIVSEEPRDDFPPHSNKVKIQFINSQRMPGQTSNVTDLSYLEGLDKCDQVIYSVTSYKNLKKQFGDNKSFWSKAKTIQHIFFESVKTKNIIGVTGTKGKGTTSTLIHQMLKESGYKVFLGGNIGISVLDFVNEVKEQDWVVLELSSFQLYNLAYSPHIAVCLTVISEHLDWHLTTDDYVEAKANIFKHQTASDIAIYFADNLYSQHIAGSSKGVKIPYFEKPGAYVRDDGVVVVGEDETQIIRKNDIKLLGRHNLENVCAALTAFWQIKPDVSAARKVLASFSGLPHRMEFVREIDNVKFYNDSFASAPSATVAAMETLPEKKVVIVGGFDRKLPLDDLIKGFQKNHFSIRRTLIVGASAKRLAQELGAAGYDNFEIDEAKSMTEIVTHAHKLAQPGDAVVLSPGFASFDMFKNFEVRGDEFKKAVIAL